MIAVARRHWLIGLLLLAGLVLRVLTQFAYSPALLYIDSLRYLGLYRTLDPSTLDPLGYPLILHLLLPLGGLAAVAAVQHLMGLLMGVGLYLLGTRYTGRRWLSALAAAPVLLDAYQLQIEQNIMSDEWLEVLLVALLLVSLLPRRFHSWYGLGLHGLAIGLLLGVAMTVRTVAVVALPVFLLLLLLAGARWRSAVGRRVVAARVLGLVLGFGLVVGGYVGYFHAYTGSWGFSTSSGNSAYGRTAVIADCATLDLTPAVRQLCPAEPLGQRRSIDYYAHIDDSPDWVDSISLPPGETLTDLQHQFAVAVARQQPVELAGRVLADFGKGFSWPRGNFPGDVLIQRWQFQDFYPDFYLPSDLTTTTSVNVSGTPPQVRVGLAEFLRGYQLHGGYTPGPLLAISGLLGIFAGIAHRRPDGVRAAALVCSGTGLALLLSAAAFEFSWRYQLPGLVLLPMAGALGLHAVISRKRAGWPAGAGRSSVLATFPDQVDAATLSEFRGRYGDPIFAPVLVVIAAYNEADSIGPVLAGMPRRCAGHDVDVLVVVDGARDNTAEIAKEHGVYTAIAPRNRGQGAALRLGYHLAGAHGADYVVTTDADGQYDIGELSSLLAPLCAGEADFVTGSRRLGSEDTTDRVRWLGVRVFATLASLLTRQKITDTSFGFRAMHASLAASLRLRQPQYQSAELMLAALGRGARLRELPMTMRVRGAGTSKKGNNLVYGFSYARSMCSTWWREYQVARK
ncbi:MAG: glycosyltransferase family 2 protein [Sciscionella sp.]